MVWNSIVDSFRGKPQLPPGPTRLPDYFPVEPHGCERPAQKLFACIANEATLKAREMEKLGYHKSYYPDVDVKPPAAEAQTAVEGENLPKPGDNPLDECRLLIAYYKRCCDRELKKKKNWILTEPYRVQEEYRYQQASKKN